ncbi:unnamed protein product [marine sediment metagenome]|uniref:Uncharacterized protein n=1 Tax=marine sediment metagenome TaxID=412755 RepID=X1PSU4_9ZZZZ
MSKVDKPPVDVRHECAYIEEIGKKLEARGWTYAKKYDFYRNEDNTVAYLPRPASSEPVFGFSFDEYAEYFKLAELPYKGNWELVKTLSYEKYGVSVDYIVEIIRALFGGFSAKVMGSIVIGFLPKTNPPIIFVPYKDDYAIFLIAPLSYENGDSIKKFFISTLPFSFELF